MKILMTNNALATRSGSELYVQEVAQELVKRGHEVVAFSTQVGELADVMRAQGVFVTDDLEAVPWTPDIIHGQHHLETMIALMYFPTVPAIYICHGWRPWQETPPLHPHIVRYFAVDTMTRDHMIQTHEQLHDRIDLLHNFVDTKRFAARGSLPKKPTRAVIFSNYATKDNFIRYIHEACDRTGIEVDVIGASYGTATDEPEKILGQYDLAFAVGRSALECLACGVPVIICGAWGIGPMVTSAELDRLRDQNFGTAAMYTMADVDAIVREISRYNAHDAVKVTSYIREHADIVAAVNLLEQKYHEVLVQKYEPDRTEDIAYETRYWQQIAMTLKEKIHSTEILRSQVYHRNHIIHHKEQDLHDMHNTMMEIERKKEEEIAFLRSSKFWRLRERYIRIKKIFN